MSAVRDVFVGDDDRADERVDDGLLGELAQRWVEQARADGRDEDARALEGHDDLADDLADAGALKRAAEDELLAAFRRDVEREFALTQLHQESEGDDVFRGPR